jgi:tetratricopeptide (TPR) repeat protein
LRWDSLEAILVLRHDLQKLDTRFGQLGSDGIFAALDRSGALRHGVQGVDNVKKAMSEPPADGRAHLRGECVRRFYPRQGLYFCDWSGVWDEENHRWLDLSEPFTTEEHWQADPVSDLMRLNPLCGTLRDMLSQARQSYYQGQYRAARRLLETVHTLRIELDEERRLELLRLRAWVQSRLGYLNCTEILNEISQNCQESFWLILDYISVYRFEGLVPRPEIAVWIRKAEEFLNRNPAVAPDRIAVFREYQGYYMMTEGRLEKARALLETARNAPDNASRDVRIACRASAALAEVYRRLGQTRQASELAERTATEQAQNLFEGDRAEFALPCLAKLQTDRDSSLAILRQALDIQTRLGHKMGLARTLLLQARLTPDADCAQAIKLNILDLRSRLPALAGCNLLAKIIDRWAEWTDGERSADQSGDVFWGV